MFALLKLNRLRNLKLQSKNIQVCLFSVLNDLISSTNKTTLTNAKIISTTAPTPKFKKIQQNQLRKKPDKNCFSYMMLENRPTTLLKTKTNRFSSTKVLWTTQDTQTSSAHPTNCITHQLTTLPSVQIHSRHTETLHQTQPATLQEL